MAENLESIPELQEGQQVIMPIDQPIKETGHIQVQLYLECAALPLLLRHEHNETLSNILITEDAISDVPTWSTET